MAKDYYKILGIEKSAQKEDVKKAFRKLAQKYHPDKTNGDEAMFKEINEAYQVLSDDRKRAEYDTYGQTFDHGAGPGAGGFGGFDFSQAGGFNIDLDDIFGDFFGGGRRRGRTNRGRDISIDVELTFNESVFGAERKILLTKNGYCDTCKGAGAKEGTEMIKCTTCGGQGTIRDVQKSVFGTFATNRECENCNGKGKTPKEKCATCRGDGVMKKTEEIRVVIPPGIENGEMIRMSNKGEAVSGGVPGDLYIKIHVETHSTFRREGPNLLMDLPIKLSDALLGTEYKIQTLEGELGLKIPEGINHGETLRVRNKGVPISQGKRGDVLVRIQIKLPTKLSKKACETIEKLKDEGI